MVLPWYNRGMNIELDPTREHILSKITAKTNATKKIQTKVENLDSQIDIYANAIENTKLKLASQQERLAQFEESKSSLQSEEASRQEEIDWMGEILERYDLAYEEGERLGEYMRKRIEGDVFIPGSEKSSLEDDAEFQKVRKRKLYLNDLMEACKADVNKIMVSRGQVSDYNVMGRKGV
jgi:hypothetical protein